MEFNKNELRRDVSKIIDWTIRNGEEDLDLGKSELTVYDWEHLMNNLYFKNPEISSINLRYSKINDAGKRILKRIKKYPTMRDIDVSYCKLTNDQLIIFNDLNQTQLNSLNLSYNLIGYFGISILAKGLIGSTITKLDISFNKFGTIGAIALGKHLKDTVITDLAMNSNKIGDEGAKCLSDGLKYSKVEILSLRSIEIGETGCEDIVNALMCIKIKKLNLCYNSIGLNGVKSIANLINQTEISDLILRDCKIDDSGAVVLAKAIENSNIKLLNIRDNEITDVGMIAIANSLKHTEINTFDFDFDYIGSDAAKSLARAIKDDSKINYLGSNDANDLQLIFYNELKDENGKVTGKIDSIFIFMKSKSVEYFLEIIPSFSCHSLVLYGEKTFPVIQYLDSFLCKNLIDVISNTKITTLRLLNCNIDDEGAENLANGLKNSKISSLSLRNNKIGDNGFKAIANALKGSIINHLNLINNKCNQEGVEAFTKALDDYYLLLEFEFEYKNENIMESIRRNKFLFSNAKTFVNWFVEGVSIESYTQEFKQHFQAFQIFINSDNLWENISKKENIKLQIESKINLGFIEKMDLLKITN